MKCAGSMQTFKLFVSSPGDVMVERRRVENVVSRLNGEFAGVARLEAIRWETDFYQAYSTFQAQIPRSTDCDLVIGILSWRLGTELPPDFGEKLPDNRPFPSGTAYEILTAVEKRQTGAKLPDVYVFRFTGSSPPVTIDDPNRERIEHDWQALKSFFQEWFFTERGHFKAAFNQYSSEDDFEAQLERLLRNWVADKVAGGRVVRWPIEVKGSPFRGLSAFGAKHAPVFFGRNHDTTAPSIYGGRPEPRIALFVGCGRERLGKVLAGPRRPGAATDNARRHQGGGCLAGCGDATRGQPCGTVRGAGRGADAGRGWSAKGGGGPRAGPARNCAGGTRRRQRSLVLFCAMPMRLPSSRSSMR